MNLDHCNTPTQASTNWKDVAWNSGVTRWKLTIIVSICSVVVIMAIAIMVGIHRAEQAAQDIGKAGAFYCLFEDDINIFIHDITKSNFLNSGSAFNIHPVIMFRSDCGINMNH